MPYATSNDVEAAWRSLTASEHAVATALTEYASAMLDGRWDDISDRIEDGKLDASLVRLAVVQMVKRVMVNPEGARSRSEAIDDHRESLDFGEAGGLSGALEITRAETRLVAPTSARAPASTIRVKPGMW